MPDRTRGAHPATPGRCLQQLLRKRLFKIPAWGCEGAPLSLGRFLSPPSGSSGPLPGRIAAGRPAEGENRKGNERKRLKSQLCDPSRSFFFWALWSENAFLPKRCQKKNLEALSPESGAVGDAKGPQTGGKARGGPSDFCRAHRARAGSFPECAPGPVGSFPEFAPGPAGKKSEGYPL